jgi:hypothetical protein
MGGHLLRVRTARRGCRRVLEQDLAAAHPAHDLVAEAEPGGAEGLDLARDVVDFELDAVPAARLRDAAVGHRLGGAAGTADGVEQQAQVSPGEGGEAGSRMELDGEAEVPGVERDRGVDVVDDVADTHGGHGWRSLPCSCGARQPAFHQTGRPHPGWTLPDGRWSWRTNSGILRDRRVGRTES